MYVNERDQINYHGFLRALREMNDASQEGVSKGICTVSGMNRFENGNRVAEKLMRDRLTARLGISGEKYEDYLQPKEFVRWEQRLRIVKAVEKRAFAVAKEELESYAQLPSLNGVNKQFIETMHFMIASLEGAPQDVLLDSISKAVKFTVPNVNKALEGIHLLSDQEINLIAEQMRLKMPKKVVRDENAWRISEYQKLISYIDDSRWEKLQKAKIYPKIVVYICELLLAKELTEDSCRYALALCHNAIELLRDSSRLYYFIELTEMRRTFAEHLLACDIETAEKTELEEMLSENNEWEKVFKELYAEYEVAPYMSDFCYLYYETECHDMVDVIETRRNMLGLSRVRLSDGICTDKTIIRCEREGRNPSIEVVRRLFEKMGMCAEYRRARVITNNAEALLLANEVSKNANNFVCQEWEDNLKRLTGLLNMEIAHNKQEIMRLKTWLRNKMEKMDENVLLESTKMALEYTLPVKALEKKGKKYLTRTELLFVSDFAFRLHGEMQSICIDILEQYCNGKIRNNSFAENIIELEIMMSSLASYYGDKGKFEKSNDLSDNLLKECLASKRMRVLSDMLYNKLWNNQTQGIINNIADKEYIKDSLSECAMLCNIVKKYNWQAFFQKKLQNYV